MIMKMMHKYLLKEYLAPVIFCLAGFCSIYIVCSLFDNLSKFMDAQTPPLLIAKYYLYFLGPNIENLIPASLLLATLYTLWQLSRHNEITAMRASGVSFKSIMTPFLCVGVIFSIATSVIKETWSPQATIWTRDFARNNWQEPTQKIENNLIYYDRITHRRWIIGSMDMKNSSILHNLEIREEREDGSKSREIMTPRAEYMDGTWWMFGGNENSYSPSGGRTNSSSISKRGTEFTDIIETPEDIVIDKIPPEARSSREIKKIIARSQGQSSKSKARLKADFHNRLAMPWACLIITLFGLPLGARTGRQSALAGIITALVCFFCFYGLIQIGMLLAAKRVIWAWLGAWLSNIVFSVVGITMISKVK